MADYPEQLERISVRGIPFDDLYGDTRPTSNSSPALSSSIIALAGAGRLIGFSVYSNRGSSQFIQVFDAQTTPSNGAVPVTVFTVAATSNLGVYWGPPGRWMNQGVVLCNSSTAATLTLGSADTFFDVQVL
jgi:hypothetical protein